MSSFNIGDHVVVKNGQRKMKITELSNGIAHCVWDVSEETQEGYYPFEDIEIASEDNV
jgi:uncharacterized protein YodC (DUF2158 family)